MDLVVVSCAIPPLSWEHRRRRAPLSKTAFRAARGTCPGTRRKQAGGGAHMGASCKRLSRESLNDLGTAGQSAPRARRRPHSPANMFWFPITPKFNAASHQRSFPSAGARDQCNFAAYMQHLRKKLATVAASHVDPVDRVSQQWRRQHVPSLEHPSHAQSI
jgi:hypothetical protein